MEPRAKVFLSYRRADSQHVAGRAGDKLADRYDLFMDVDTIPPGVDYTDYLHRAVGGCDVLVALIGERWAEATDGAGRRRLDDPDDWVVAEISTALARGVPVIPVLVDGARLPADDLLPAVLRPLSTRQTVPLRHESFSADLAHLIAGIDHAAAISVPAVEAEGAAEAARPGDTAFADHWDQTPKPLVKTPAGLTIPSSRPSRRVPALIGAVVLAVAGIGTWLVLRGAAAGPNAPGQPTPASASVPPVTSATPVTAIPPATTVSALRLRVPSAFRGSCRELKPSDPSLAVQLVVGVQCFPTKSGNGARPQYSFYLQYADAAAATAAFRSYYAAGPAGPGDCIDSPGEVADDRGDGSGVLRCYQDSDGFLVFAWTSPEQAIVAAAADRDLSYGQLTQWWGGAGPQAR